MTLHTLRRILLPSYLSLCLLTHRPSVGVSVVKLNANIVFLLSSTSHSIPKTNVNLKDSYFYCFTSNLTTWTVYTVVTNYLLV